ncbi:alpha/beta hydrolase family protein [Rufibacter sp. LB8]|uniref:alpha/beta hydrolase n=1 Tax=Rufibacter sp. LB8 TaxID=2777781 RepID=UPI00178C804E|nr:alpha/beta hydrolase-fold protein [Rufibacter sp. LB8]
MKNLLVFFLWLVWLPVLGQQSSLQVSLKTKSTVLGKEVEYSIYLPAGYATAPERFPVLYLLHGYGGDETDWALKGDVQAQADSMIQAGQIPAMVIVMPDAGGTYYINSHDGRVRYEDFFITEFLPFIDKTYKTKATQASRAVAGLSMGGFGSLQYAIRYPHLFSVAAPLSAAVRTDTEFTALPAEAYNRIFGAVYGTQLSGQARLNTHWYQHSVLKMVETAPAEDLKKVKFYIDCGDDDYLIKGNMALHAALIDRQVPHEFRVRDGGHSWSYWQTGLPEVLLFVGSHFKQ